MSVFHPYGVSRESAGPSSSSGDSLNLKVRNIRLNFSRTVQTSLISAHNDLASSFLRSGTEDDANNLLKSNTLSSQIIGTSRSSASSLSFHNVVRFSGMLVLLSLLVLYQSGTCSKKTHFCSLRCV